MNTERPSPSGMDHYRSLQILDELSNNDSLTQRDLSSHLGIALGLVNSYIKNLVAKGYIIVKSIPPKRYAYYLTPKGFAEKTRLTYDLLNDYTRVYREAKTNLKNLFREMQKDGVRNVVFAGADEVAEIAYITLQETNMELVGVVDSESADKKFFGRIIQPLDSVKDMQYDRVMITTYIRRKNIHKYLIANGIKEQDIKVVFAV